jgi:putative glutamine amidotransferase
MAPHLRIGFSACFFHHDATRPIFKGKRLMYLEESIAHWLMQEGVLGFLVPTIPKDSALSLRDIVHDLDGLILQGGSDVAPSTYGEKALKPEWGGDAFRDAYEIALIKECMHQKKPILGICRGAQILNVAFGGTLYQDIGTQLPKAISHRNWDVYDQLFHVVKFEKGSVLEKIFKTNDARVNSVHHQGVKDLGKDLVVEARAVDDGMVEAIRLKSENFVFAFQWHPEFHAPTDGSLLDCRPILREFLRAASEEKKGRNAARL